MKNLIKEDNVKAVGLGHVQYDLTKQNEGGSYFLKGKLPKPRCGGRYHWG
jgi:hypothetical protein